MKLQHSDWKANLVKDFFEKMNFPPMRALKFITGHMTYDLAYTEILQMTTTQVNVSYVNMKLVLREKMRLA